jgi:hypothetical protein
MLIVVFVFYIVVTLFSGLFGILTTKETCAATKATFKNIRPLIVLLISYIIGWEKLSSVETPIKLTGFIIAFIGTLIYNNVWIVIPFYKLKN